MSIVEQVRAIVGKMIDAGRDPRSIDLALAQFADDAEQLTTEESEAIREIRSKCDCS
jgi:hypothetical protein